MSDEFYIEVLEEVNETVEEFGTTYQVQGAPSYNNDTMTTVEGVTRTIIGLVADQAITNEINAFEGSKWLSTKTLIMTASANPQPGEYVIVEGKKFSLDSVQPIKPANITVLYLLDISK